MQDLHLQVLPEQVYFDVDAGRVRAGAHEIDVHTDWPVVAAKRGEQGYFPIQTRRTAAELNEPGIEADVLEAMLVGSIFGWHLPIVDQACARLRVALKPIIIYHLEDTSWSFEARAPEGAAVLWRRGCYRKVATVFPGCLQGLDALEEAWRLTNTIEAPWYAGAQVVMDPQFAKGCRSSSAGDIFEMPDSSHHLVVAFGFQLIDISTT